MNLQQLRDMVRTQLDLDETDLPDLLLDNYIQEGYDRAIGLDQRWPFFAFQWSIDFDADGLAQMPADANHIQMMTAGGRVLDRIDGRQAYEWFSPDTVGTATAWTRRNRQLQVYPAPGNTLTVRATGYRMPSNWIGQGASGECDADRRLHIPIAWYACSLGYAQQEDEVLEQTYLNRFKESAAEARDIIMRPEPTAPLQLSYASYKRASAGPRWSL